LNESVNIPFNKPYITGKELFYISEVLKSGKLSGDGEFTGKCHEYLENLYGFKKCFLTSSCTDALEMSSILINIKAEDEIIMPSYTFVSSANAFALRGAKIMFADCEKNIPNISPDEIERLITKKTIAVVIMHYAGISCDMNRIMEIVNKNNLVLIEDAALALDSKYKDKPLGTFGKLSTFSFHDTKNIIAGECGCLAINDEQYISRAEIIREKGTNRSRYIRNEISRYEWIDIGSSFLPSEITAGFLLAQLENLETIQNRRKEIWYKYFRLLKPLDDSGYFKLPLIPDYAKINGHIFYLVCNSLSKRNNLMMYLKDKGINTTFHYLPLHKSKYFNNYYNGQELTNVENFSNCLIRLPLFFELTDKEIEYIVSAIFDFFENK